MNFGVSKSETLSRSFSHCRSLIIKNVGWSFAASCCRGTAVLSASRARLLSRLLKWTFVMTDAYFQRRTEEGVGPELTLSTRITGAGFSRVVSFPASFSV